MQWRLACAGVLIHALLIYSIFDIYYTSPIVTNVPSHEITSGIAPAKRLVMFTADGLRSDTFARHPEKSPFLHSLIRERKGVYAISRSHVPTESRPGHVAIFAGFTEDVSAVARGWKHNPVQFDSIFNRSRESWMWGSPDIVTLFDNYPTVHSFMYSSTDEDFGSNEAYKLDEWVFNHVEKFFNETQSDPELKQRLMSDRLVFFLHLLGLDTNGHGNKPRSQEYLDNIEVVDRGIERIQQVINGFFDDNSTAFVMTADHGMTDWGSHGAGTDEEVLTPFVAWGAGVQKSGVTNTISQVDLTPFLAALIGVAVPVNSMGVLPTQALDVSPNYLFKSSLANFLQLKEQFMVLRAEKAKRLWFQEFDTFGLKALESLETEILKLAKLRRFAAASSLFVQNAPYIKKAIFHYHRYDRAFLGAAISCCFMAWIALVWCYLTRDRSLSIFTRNTLVPNRMFSSLIGCMMIFCIYCRLPLTNWFYLLLPLFLLSVTENVLNATTRVYEFTRYCVQNYSTASFTFLLQPFLGAIGTSILLFVFVIIFMDRRFLSALFVLLTFVPYLYSSSAANEWKRAWQLTCIALIPFPFLPNVGKSEIPLLCIGAPLTLAIILRELPRHPLLEKKSENFRKLSAMLMVTATLILVSSYLFQKPPALLRLISWLSLPFSLLLPLFSPPTIVDRISWFICSLFVPYSLLSIAYESTFMLCFVPLLLMYLRFEFGHMSATDFLNLPADRSFTTVCTSPSRRVAGAELSRAVICVSFVLAAIFGTGNFASMNSFNPSTLSRFISVFSPFTMATLLVLKIFIPLLMISLLFAAVLRFDHEAIQRHSCLVLIITDLMAMCFFHQLKDDGSWLDIGLSISQYLISICTSVAILLLLLCASTLMTTTLSHYNVKKLKSVLKGEQSDCLL
ncbi:hypothetical protein V3C99_006125 [Haemonchus contortus]